MKRWILVTGGAGYIGSVLVRQLLRKGYEVRVLDSLLWGGDSLKEVAGHPRFEFVRGDIRDADLVKTALKGVQTVVHLAAIVGDPASKKFPKVTKSVNWDGSMLLWEAAERAGVERFIFASTCSNYGIMKGQTGLLDEDSALQPQSTYAKTKVKFEEFLLHNALNNISKTILRFSTVYGYSPRARFDLTINHFCRDMLLGHKLDIFGENQWRPYCHVQDLAASVVNVLGHHSAEMAGQVFNIGDSKENYTKRMIVDKILERLPGAEVKFSKRKSTDKRDYQVDFSKARMQLGFKISRNVDEGIDEMIRVLNTGIIGDPFDPKYQNA